MTLAIQQKIYTPYSRIFQAGQLTYPIKTTNSNINFAGSSKNNSGLFTEIKNKPANVTKSFFAKAGRFLVKSAEYGNYATCAAELGLGLAVNLGGLDHGFIFDVAQKYLHIKPSLLAQAPFIDASRHLIEGATIHFASKKDTWLFMKNIISKLPHKKV